MEKEKIKILSRKLARDLDKQFGKGYAKKHPKALGIFVAAALLDSKKLVKDVTRERPNIPTRKQIDLIAKRLGSLRKILLNMGKAILQEIQ